MTRSVVPDQKPKKNLGNQLIFYMKKMHEALVKYKLNMSHTQYFCVKSV